MKLNRRARTAAAVATVAVCLVPLVTATTPAVASPATGTSGASTSSHVQPAAQSPRGATSLGSVPENNSVSGAVVLKPRDEAALKTFITNATDRNSPQYHDYLTPPQFASRFGPAAQTVKAVEAELKDHGLRVTDVTADGLVVKFTGTAHSAEGTFHTSLKRYRLSDGSIGQGTTAGVQLSSKIASSVSAVVGLDQLVKLRPSLERAASRPASTTPAVSRTANITYGPGDPKPCPQAASAASNLGALTDDQVANAYGAFGLYNQPSADFGSGQHIGVVEFEPFLPSDLQNFDTCYFGATASAQMAGTNGVAGGRLNIVKVDGGQPTGAGFGEAILDVSDLSALAPQANLDVYEAPNTTFGAIDLLAQIVNSDTDQVISQSWGLCEQAAQASEPGTQQAENVLLEQAAAQGQSLFASSGDSGSDDCAPTGSTSPVKPTLSVDDPASQPYAVSVGGTTILNSNQPPSESVWNDGASGGAGGGGISQSWAMPAWQSTVPGSDPSTVVSQAETFEAGDLGLGSYDFCQTEVSGLANTPCREVPDVSANANEQTGITVYSSSFTGPTAPSGWTAFGGTSSAAPIWAASMALINASSSCGPDLVKGVQDAGFASPLLYQAAALHYSTSFNHPSFSNPFGSANNDPYGHSNLFPTTSNHYDMATGLGSPQLVQANGNPGLAATVCAAPKVVGEPTVTGVSPAFGSTTATTTVTVTGTGFEVGGASQVAGVEVGGLELPANVVSNTSLTVTLPPASHLIPPLDTTDGAGAYQIIVTLTNGQSSATGPNSVFEYVNETGSSPIPTVTGVDSYGGPEGGGNTVDIFGSGFTGATKVAFGGVSATPTVLSDWHIQATVPKYSSGATTCAQQGALAGENATNDVCQTAVVVTNGNGSSSGPAPKPLFEGSLTSPVPASEETVPQPDEYDYLAKPTITNVSTTTPATLASENGGTPITVTGTGLNLAGLDWIDLGDPTQLSSQVPLTLTYVSGTEIQFRAPALFTTVGEVSFPFSVKSLVDQSPAGPELVYAGVPTVSSVVATNGPSAGTATAPDSGGTSISLAGAGFSAATKISFGDAGSGNSTGSQSTLTITNDSQISATTVATNPGLDYVRVCSVTGCTPTPTAELFLFPAGAPRVNSISPSSTPADGGVRVTIDGSNLGCVQAVSFGSTPATGVSNAPASPANDCGSESVVNATVPPLPAGTALPHTVTVTVQTAGTVDAHSPAATGSFTYEPGSDPGYRMYTTAGIIYTFGADRSFGTLAGVHLNRPIVGGTATPDGKGYWLVATDGGIFSFGDAHFYGSTGGIRLNKPIVGMASTGDGKGYWLVATDGGIFAFGDARFYGSTGAIRLNKPVVGMARTGDGKGYWMVATDGGIFSFGDARFYGSTGGVRLAKPIGGMVPTSDGRGYWMVASDGGIFTFGDARFFGSAGNLAVGSAAVKILATPDGRGYGLVFANGRLLPFGDFRSFGSIGGAGPAGSVVDASA